jgi:hypothetical protein
LGGAARKCNKVEIEVEWTKGFYEGRRKLYQIERTDGEETINLIDSHMGDKALIYYIKQLKKF